MSHIPNFGIDCPLCPGETKVIDTMSDFLQSGRGAPKVYLNRIKRERKCLSCGHRFFTKEMPADLIEDTPESIEEILRE